MAAIGFRPLAVDDLQAMFLWLLRPHVAALTEPRTALAKIVETIERVRRGEPPLNLVDFQAGY